MRNAQTLDGEEPVQRFGQGRVAPDLPDHAQLGIAGTLAVRNLLEGVPGPLQRIHVDGSPSRTFRSLDRRHRRWAHVVLAMWAPDRGQLALPDAQAQRLDVETEPARGLGKLDQSVVWRA